MSGHSKWSQIKHKKAVVDAKRGKIFGKLAKLISVAARDKGPDPNSNPSLRAAVDKAREVNMPQDNIERAIKKGAGGNGETSLNEFVFEAYGPGGVAMIITGITDNSNRTSQEIKHILSQHGQKLASPGSVMWAFDKKDSAWVPKEYSLVKISGDDSDLLGKLIEALDEHDDVQEIFSNDKET